VRLVKMQGVDLEQFQFDYDLTWAALFIHADGAVLARYGNETAAEPTGGNSVAGLKKLMERVLVAHAGYPANRALFAAKRGPPPKYAKTDLIPSPRIQKHRGATSSEQCIHCHNIYDAYHDLEVRAGGYDPRRLWKHPPPENIGLRIDAGSGNRIEGVTEGSAAAKAGLRPGDAIEVLGGQAILSIADVQFVLHHLPEKASLAVVARRGEERVETALELSGPWRESDISWRASMWEMPPSPGLWLEDVPAAEKDRLGIAADRMALRVRGLFKPPVQRSGLKTGDVLTAFDGKDAAIGPTGFHAILALEHYRPGAVLKLEVLRDGERRRIEVAF
jgi:hypothetical protein